MVELFLKVLFNFYCCARMPFCISQVSAVAKFRV